MPTLLNNLDTQPDALVVFIDNQIRRQENTASEWMEKLFDSQQYLYLRENDMTGEELFKRIREEIYECNVILPDSQRMVFCYYLELRDLTQEWVDCFFERARELQRLLSIDNMFTHHHMICLSYENVNPLAEEKSRIIGLLQQLAQSGPSISHVIYMLHVTGFETLDSQEHGMVQLLHLVSRRDYFRVAKPMGNKTYLKMLCYADYYEDRAAACQQRIKELSGWLTQENDPELSRLLGTVKLSLNAPVQELRKAISAFRRRIPLYPISVTDFQGNPITGYRSRISDNNPIIQQRKEEYISDIKKALAERADLSNARNILEEEFHYPDFCHLESLMEQGLLEQNVLGGIDNRDNNPDIDSLARAVCGRVRCMAGSLIAVLEEKKEAVEKERRSNQRELKLAGKYRDLSNCFSRIEGDTGFSPIAGYFPENVERVVLISGKCFNDWLHQQYEIAGVTQAYRYPEIEPYEIVVLKEGDLLNLAEEDAKEKLERILN
ncbi:MAG: hypothetical protein Q4C61_07140 [Lachnospiraceae bacterium]|nr:hypothetical protein [Lachnospiraceae bacterium]